MIDACVFRPQDGQYYSFNDQHVSKISHDDIRKTYGGSVGSRGYYSSTFARYVLVRRVVSVVGLLIDHCGQV